MNDLFLPICQADMEKRGWDRLDFLIISGDAYVDHPSFGPAIIGRWLEKLGYRVGILAQPDWRSTEAFAAMGKPRLGVLVSAGNLDSMLAHYTAAKRLRSDDLYSPGGKAGYRPDRATLVYCSRIRELWKNIPLIIGGIEASLRRFAHFDYWTNKVRRSILIDSRADLLVYGMGERQIQEIAEQLASGIRPGNIFQVAGTCYRTETLENVWDYVEIPAFEEVKDDRKAFGEAFRLQYAEQDPMRGKPVVQNHGKEYLVQNPPAMPLITEEMDEVYALPYQRTYHPIYEAKGGIPAIQEVKFSLVSQRGCYGGCAFCALISHQGRIIQSRSHESLLAEARMITKLSDFKGYLHDVGGPTANFRQPACKSQLQRGTCRGKSCLSPVPCEKLEVDHSDFIALLRELRALPGIKKVFVRSGFRYDYLLLDPNKKAILKEICEHHVSGQMKVAPEHISEQVTRIMGKSPKAAYLEFAALYKAVNEELKKKQYLVPYFMSSHPGAGLKDAIELAEFLRDIQYHPEQVQDFIPTPGSRATCMYYTGVDPLTGERVYVARTPQEKRLQRALLQYRDPKNREMVYEALIKGNRRDLIGQDPLCLMRPPKLREYVAKEPLEAKKTRPGTAKRPKGKVERNNKTSVTGRSSKPSPATKHARDGKFAESEKIEKTTWKSAFTVKNLHPAKASATAKAERSVTKPTFQGKAERGGKPGRSGKIKKGSSRK
ncbi:YgiQ family radical SAM protein [Azotosporobacter soli]|uniref:YgiQ family radical SAM protein n=1 Tax=Azotosporobacter soli TaxID=3055040 RepID=UPI0031FF0571